MRHSTSTEIKIDGCMLKIDGSKDMMLKDVHEF